MPDLITMRGIKPFLVDRGMTGPQVIAATSIPKKRYLLLDSLNRKIAEEPWLDEAAAIAAALCSPLIWPLTGATELHLADLGFDMRDDLDVWLTGVPLPLSTAARLAVRFGLDDPIRIHQLDKAAPIERQYREMLATGERTDGLCPFCRIVIVGSAGHIPTCMLNLWMPRDRPLSTIGVGPKPGKPGVRRLGDSHKAPGLKGVRERAGLTQAQMAASLNNMHPNYYSRLERCADPLSSANLELICALYKVQRHEVLTA